MLARARHALQIGQDELAREAVLRHLRARRSAERYQRAWQQQQDGMARLHLLIEMLEEHRIELEQRRQQILLRYQLARTRRALSESLFGERNRLGLERAEEAVLKEEFTVDAYQELTGNVSMTDTAVLDDVLDPHAVEQVLFSLRTELGLPAPGMPASAPDAQL
jgi:phage shock protein A